MCGDGAAIKPQLCYDAGCMSGFTGDSCLVVQGHRKGTQHWAY